MHLLPRPLLALLFLVGAPFSFAIADESKAPKPAKGLDCQALDAFIAKQAADKGFVGVSVAIMEHGKVALAKGYGKESLKDDKPVGPETLFGAGSVTKQITCACVLLLAQDGKLSVD